jgi:hypothetical protein
VFLSGIGSVNNLMPAFRKIIFPSAMPFGFVLPPKITSATTFVGPVPHLDFSALCYQRLIASWALTGKIWLGLFALPIDECKFHGQLSAPYLIFHNSPLMGEG